MIRPILLSIISFPIAAFSASTVNSSSAASQQGVQIITLPDRLRVELNSHLFTEYFFKDVPRPYCYPVLGPGEEHDHKHHRSLWFAHGAINGQDFWTEQGKFGKTIHEGFAEIRSGSDVGVIKSTNKWVSAEGAVVCTDDRTLRFHKPGSDGERILD